MGNKDRIGEILERKSKRNMLEREIKCGENFVFSKREMLEKQRLIT